MKEIIPDIQWSKSTSEAKEIQPRCPFASVAICPRYYLSISILGDADISTKIEEKRDKELLNKWKKSDLFPANLEQDTMISGKNKAFNRFCPEVAFDIFGIFASDFARHKDEIDLSVAHKKLSKMSAPPNHWRWQWSYVTPLHYSDCPIFSVLLEKNKIDHKEQDIVDIKPNFYGIGVNVNEVFKRVKRFIKKKG